MNQITTKSYIIFNRDIIQAKDIGKESYTFHIDNIPAETIIKIRLGENAYSSNRFKITLIKKASKEEINYSPKGVFHVLNNVDGWVRYVVPPSHFHEPVDLLIAITTNIHNSDMNCYFDSSYLTVELTERVKCESVNIHLNYGE